MPYAKSYFSEIFLQYFQNKELDEFYLSFFLRSLAESLINIFIPIYLLQLGYGLFDVALYYLIYYLALAIFMAIGMLLNAKIGIKKTMALGTIILLGAFYLLNGLDGNSLYYWVALVFGISGGIYWSAFHLEFVKANDEKNKEEGKELSVIKIITIIASILGPLTGALIISKISFSFLFLIVAVFLILSIIPLFLSKDFKSPLPKRSIKGIFEADTPRKAIVYQADGALNVVSSIFWPIFIYLTLGSITYLGGIISFTSLLMIFFVFYIGKLVDRDNNKAIKLGTFLHAPTWILRLFLFSPIGVFVSNFLNSITISIISLSFGKTVYTHAEQAKNKISYFLFRDFYLNFGRAIILIAVMLTQSLTWTFVIASLITFAHLLSLKKK